MNFNNSGNPGFWRTRSKQTFGWGTGQPWCDGVAAKGWIYRPGGSWLVGNWEYGYNGIETPYAYSPQVVAGGVQVQGQGQYQAYHNGTWSTYFQWGNIMYPPTYW